MKPIKTTVIILLIIAVLGAGFFALLKTDPKKDAQASPSFSSAPTISVFKTEKENITELEVTADGENYVLTKQEDKWVVNHDSSVKISQSKADTLAYECSSVTVKQVAAENVSDFSAFGLSSPKSRVVVHLKDGETKTMLIGDKTADGSLGYLMLEGESTVYAKSVSGLESLAPKLEKLRDTSLYSVSEDKVTAITIARQGAHRISLTREKIAPAKEGEEPTYQWKMQEPLQKAANEYNLNEKILKTILAISFESVADNNAQNLEQYGLSEPYAAYTIADDKTAYGILVGKENGTSRYVKMADDNVIYLVESSKLAFLETGYLQLVDKLIYLENIDGITGVTIQGAQNYEMQIEGSGDSAGYKINGTPVSEDTFKSAYQAVLGITLDDFTDVGVQPKGSAECTISYHKKDGTDSQVAFYSWDERNYLVRVNGAGNLLCRKKQVSNMLEKLAQSIAE